MRKGFSLLEFILAVLILGILLYIGIPKLNSYLYAERIKSFTYKLLADIDYTRSLAYKKGCSKIKFNSNNYEIISPCNGTVIKRLSIPKYVKVSTNLGKTCKENEIKFKRNELPICSGNLTIKDKENRERYKIIFNVNTGEFRID